MTTITPIEPEAAPEKSRALLEDFKRKRGTIPGLLKVLAHSPAALQGYVSLATAMAGSKLGPADRERIAISTAEANGCNYCLTAHARLGKAAGLSEPEVEAARDGASGEARAAALLAFSNRVLERRGKVDPSDVEAMRRAGFDEAEIVEAVIVTVQNVLTNYMNNVARTPSDFAQVLTTRRG